MGEAVTEEVTEEATTEVTTDQTSEVTTEETTSTTEEVTTEETTEVTEEVTTEENTEEETTEVPSLDKFSEEFEQTQSLSDESYDELAEMGYDRAMVDAYIRGATQVVTPEVADKLIEDFGGQEAYDAMTAWASKNLTVGELETFNGALQTKQSSEMAMTWLKGKMEAAEGYDPKVNLAGAPKADVFTSKEDVKATIRDKRWGKDKAWTRQMEAKIGRSKLF